MLTKLCFRVISFSWLFTETERPHAVRSSKYSATMDFALLSPSRPLLLAPGAKSKEAAVGAGVSDGEGAATAFAMPDWEESLERESEWSSRTPQSCNSVRERPTRSRRRKAATGSLLREPFMASGPGLYQKGGWHQQTFLMGDFHCLTLPAKKSSICGGQRSMPSTVQTSSRLLRAVMTCSHFLCHLKMSLCFATPLGKMLRELHTSPSRSLTCTLVTEESPKTLASFCWICGTEAKMKSEVIVTEAKSGPLSSTAIASATAASTSESCTLAKTEERSATASKDAKSAEHLQLA
mmetsp:Transcript_30461/g.76579  ORF Transcript_30461/g.76579 Transcript_30461/m.76579 type:complete len:294 (-) Transcript_30461:742-1623(-)